MKSLESMKGRFSRQLLPVVVSTVAVCASSPVIGAPGVSVVHTFTAPVAAPRSTLLKASDGNYYGTSVGSFGTIFKMTPAGVVTVIHAFNGADGQQPIGDLIQAADGAV
jgi:uncharacterized repeat protein (TIGR03803 family)